MIISSSVVFVILILMWDWDQQGFQFLNKPNKFEKKKTTNFLKDWARAYSTLKGQGETGREREWAAEPGGRLCGACLCACDMLLAPALAGAAGCLVPCPPGGQQGGPTLDSSQKGHCPSLLPDSLPPLCPEIFLFLNRAPWSRLPVEECSLRGPSRAPLSAWHRPRSAGTSLRISLSWANTASPALQIPLSSSFASPPS